MTWPGAAEAAGRWSSSRIKLERRDIRLSSRVASTVSEMQTQSSASSGRELTLAAARSSSPSIAEQKRPQAKGQSSFSKGTAPLPKHSREVHANPSGQEEAHLLFQVDQDETEASSSKSFSGREFCASRLRPEAAEGPKVRSPNCCAGEKPTACYSCRRCERVLRFHCELKSSLPLQVKRPQTPVPGKSQLQLEPRQHTNKRLTGRRRFKSAGDEERAERQSAAGLPKLVRERQMANATVAQERRRQCSATRVHPSSPSTFARRQARPAHDSSPRQQAPAPLEREKVFEDDHQRHQRVAEADDRLTNCQQQERTVAAAVSATATSFYCHTTGAASARRASAATLRPAGQKCETSQQEFGLGEDSISAGHESREALPKRRRSNASNLSKSTTTSRNNEDENKSKNKKELERSKSKSERESKSKRTNANANGCQRANAPERDNAGRKVLTRSQILFNNNQRTVAAVSCPSLSSATQKGACFKSGQRLLVELIVTVALVSAAYGLLSIGSVSQRRNFVTLAAAAAAAPSSAASEPVFVNQPNDKYFVRANQMVVLPCQISVRRGECNWFRNGKLTYPSEQRSYSRSTQNGDCGLRLNATLEAADGEWDCSVGVSSSSDGELDNVLQSRRARLVVLVAPQRPRIKDLSTGLNRLVLQEQSERNITCEVSGGNPTPQIEWFLDGKSVGFNATTSHLKDEKLVQSRLLLNRDVVKRSLNGKNLTCLGVHQTGNQSASIELEVQYVPSVSIAQKEITLVEGTPLHIPCQVDANPSPTQIRWRLLQADSGGTTKPGGQAEPLKVSHLGPNYDLDSVSRAYNRHSFECTALNSLGLSAPATVRLNILFPPQAINASSASHSSVGTDKRLHCLFEGNPQPEIKWLYKDPLSRSSATVLVDNARELDPQLQHQARPKTLVEQQFLTIRNLTYRNEGEYVCEARNTINGHSHSTRSSPITLDVVGVPQFLVKSPFHSKVVQGSKSDVALTFCADPPPIRVYWQFGSLQLEVRTSAGDSMASPPGQAALDSRYLAQRLQPLQRRDPSMVQKEATCFEAVLTLFSPELSDQRDYTLYVTNPLGSGHGVVRLRVASPLSPALMITSALVFICGLFLCSLLVLLVIRKREQLLGLCGNHHNRARSMRNGGAGTNGTASAANGATQQALSNGASRNGRASKKAKSETADLEQSVNGQANGKHNGNVLTAAAAASLGQQNNSLRRQHQQQANGVVNGFGNGLANSASNPAALSGGLKQRASPTSSVNQLLAVDHERHRQQQAKGLVHGLMSVASSDTSCNDQKQLLVSNCSDRNSSVGSGGSSSGVVLGATAAAEYLNQHDQHHLHSQEAQELRRHGSQSNGSGRSTASSTPSPMNHISVDDELHLNGAYQTTEPITRGARLASGPMSPGALIYANIDYATRNSTRPGGEAGIAVDAADEGLANAYPGANVHRQQPQSPVQDGNALALSGQPGLLSTALRRRQQTPQVSPTGSSVTVQDNMQQRPLVSPGFETLRQQQNTIELSNGGTESDNVRQAPKKIAGALAGRPSVGATIAMMNSLAAAQSAAAAGLGSPQSGSGALSQQLMASSAAGRVRKPGPPKPPKPSIQQRSRFYQQQVAAGGGDGGSGGLVMMIGAQAGQIGNGKQFSVQLEARDANAMTGDEREREAATPNELAVEYSRLAFPARAEL